MLRGLSSSPRAPATDECRRYFVRLRQAEATTTFIDNDAADALAFFFLPKRKCLLCFQLATQKQTAKKQSPNQELLRF
jgi:hypothetical protein